MFFGDKRRQEVSEDEIRTMVSDNEELDDEEKRMIHEVMDLGDATAEEVMTPRVDMIMVGSDETVRQAIDRMRGTGYSRLPVFRDDDDDIIGIVRYKDLIDPLLEDKEDDLAADYVAEVGFVPESKSLLPLLNEMQTNRQQMVIVHRRHRRRDRRRNRRRNRLRRCRHQSSWRGLVVREGFVPHRRRGRGGLPREGERRL